MTLYLLLVVAVVTYITIDSSRLAVSKGCVGDDYLDFGRVEWALFAAVLPLVALPIWLLRRPTYTQRRRKPLDTRP